MSADHVLGVDVEGLGLTEQDQPRGTVPIDLMSRLGDVGEHHTFAYRAFISDGRSHPAQSVRLSAREREVLEQLPSLRNLEEIAGHLAVSVNTVKSHVRAIYGKLGVSSRRTAVLAAHEQGLLV